MFNRFAFLSQAKMKTKLSKKIFIFLLANFTHVHFMSPINTNHVVIDLLDELLENFRDANVLCRAKTCEFKSCLPAPRLEEMI